MPEHDLIVVVVRFTAASAITVFALIFVRLSTAKIRNLAVSLPLGFRV